MLNKKEFEELRNFANKVAEVHGPDHSEFIEVNDIVKNIDKENLENTSFSELRELTNNYIIPEGACRAQTTLLVLLKKLDNK